MMLELVRRELLKSLKDNVNKDTWHAGKEQKAHPFNFIQLCLHHNLALAAIIGVIIVGLLILYLGISTQIYFISLFYTHVATCIEAKVKLIKYDTDTTAT